MKKLIITSILALTQLFAITYDYDDLNRLEKATYDNGVTLNYTYDDADNLLSVKSEGVVAPTDTDGDGIPDVRELQLGLDINSADSDNDGISDLEEVGDVNNPRDTDGDGTIDALDEDSDNDGMSDADEVRYGFDPLNANDANEDADGDGYTNLEEIEAGTDPRDENDTPTAGRVSLAPIDDVIIPVNGEKEVKLTIVNTTDEAVTIDAMSQNEELVVVSNTNPLYLTPIQDAKGHTKITVKISAGGMSDTKEFMIYIGEKPKKYIPIIVDEMMVIVPVDF